MDARTSAQSLEHADTAGDRGGRFEAHRLFLLLAPLLYAAYALLTPPFQSFDENQHLYRAWQISSGQFIGERRGEQSGGELPPGLAKATLRQIGSMQPWGTRQIVRRPAWEMFKVSTPAGSDGRPVYYNFFASVVYSPVGYVPQVIAVRIGQTAHLSVEWTLRLGRLINLSLCIAVVAWALRLLPFGRWIMLIIALSPPMAAGAASFGQDGLVNGSAFLLTGLGLRIAADKRWTGRRITLAGVLACAVALTKIVYLPLVAVAALPVPRNSAARTWLLPPVLTGFVAAALIYAWMHANAAAILDPFQPGIPTHAQQVSWAIGHPLDFGRLVARTWQNLPSNWALMYSFGDSTVPVIWAAAVFGTAALVAVMACGDKEARDLTRPRRLWMLVIVATVIQLIMIAMYIAQSLRGAIWIDGMQGRYLLPVLPLGAIALMRRGEAAPWAVKPGALVLVMIAHAITLGTLMTAFYSF